MSRNYDKLLQMNEWQVADKKINASLVSTDVYLVQISTGLLSVREFMPFFQNNDPTVSTNS